MFADFQNSFTFGFSNEFANWSCWFDFSVSFWFLLLPCQVPTQFSNIAPRVILFIEAK